MQRALPPPSRSMVSIGATTTLAPADRRARWAGVKDAHPPTHKI